MEKQSMFCGVKKMSICNDCARCVGLCSWSHSLQPVEGWVADYVPGSRNRLPSYCVKECPEFVKDAERIYKPTNSRYEYFKNLIQGGRKDGKENM